MCCISIQFKHVLLIFLFLGFFFVVISFFFMICCFVLFLVFCLFVVVVVLAFILCLVFPMLPTALDCPLLIAPLVFSTISWHLTNLIDERIFLLANFFLGVVTLYILYLLYIVVSISSLYLCNYGDEKYRYVITSYVNKFNIHTAKYIIKYLYIFRWLNLWCRPTIIIFK